jgi:hypothetical protein
MGRSVCAAVNYRQTHIDARVTGAKCALSQYECNRRNASCLDVDDLAFARGDCAGTRFARFSGKSIHKIVIV